MMFRQGFLTKILKGLQMIVLIVAVGSCTETYRMEVHSSFGPGIRFCESGSSFDWMPDTTKNTSDPQLDNPHLHALIKDTVEKHLAIKGYQRESTGNPDFWVTYHIARRTRGEPVMGNHFAEFAEGSLILDVFDPQSRKLIWRSSATTRLNDSMPPAQRRERIDEAVRRMLKDVRTADGKPSES